MKAQQDLLKTENLAWLRTAFEQSVCSQPGDPFLRDYQKRQFAQFSRRGLPSRREEAWKYTDLSFLENADFQAPRRLTSLPETDALRALLEERARDNDLLVFVNGVYVPQLSAVSPLPQGVILCNLQEALKTQASLITRYLLQEIDVERHPFASLNAALFSDGLFLYVPPSVALERPLHLLSLSQGSESFLIHPRHLLILEKAAQLSLTEEYRSDAEVSASLTNVRTDFFVGQDAVLNYHKIQSEAKAAKHIANVFVHQQQNSRVDASFFAVGGQFTRNDLTVFLQEAYAACQARGFYGLDSDGQLIDNHVHIEHSAPSTRSDMDYRGLLSGRSRAVFNGKVQVRPLAKKTEARQLNHTLLLSPLAEIDSKPELEIYADEVQCRHGATMGQLDEEGLFYLRSRGIDSASAKIILLHAFVEAVLSEVKQPGARAVMRDLWSRQVDKL